MGVEHSPKTPTMSGRDCTTPPGSDGTNAAQSSPGEMKENSGQAKHQQRKSPGQTPTTNQVNNSGHSQHHDHSGSTPQLQLDKKPIPSNPKRRTPKVVIPVNKSQIKTGIHRYFHITNTKTIANDNLSPQPVTKNGPNASGPQNSSSKKTKTNSPSLSNYNNNNNQSSISTTKRRRNHDDIQLHKQIKLHNKFTPLANLSDSQNFTKNIEQNPTAGNDHNNPGCNTKPEKPPPIYLRQAIRPELLREIKKTTSNFFLTALKKGSINESKIQLPTIESYRKITKILENNELPHYTYQLRSCRGQVVFIRKLDPLIDTSIIKESLEEQGFLTSSIMNIKDKKNNPLPLFKVQLDPSIVDKSLIYKVKYIGHYKVTIESPHNKPRIIQCSRCQEYGHTHNFCKLLPVCNHCGELHSSVSCPNKQAAPKCGNCGLPHSAYDRECPVYKKLQDRLCQQTKPLGRTPQPHQPFIYDPQDFAPLPGQIPEKPPTQNIWPSYQSQAAPNDGLSHKIELLTDSINGMMQMMSSLINMFQSLIANKQLT